MAKSGNDRIRVFHVGWPQKVVTDVSRASEPSQQRRQQAPSTFTVVPDICLAKRVLVAPKGDRLFCFVGQASLTNKTNNIPDIWPERAKPSGRPFRRRSPSAPASGWSPVTSAACDRPRLRGSAPKGPYELLPIAY